MTSRPEEEARLPPADQEMRGEEEAEHKVDRFSFPCGDVAGTHPGKEGERDPERR